MAARGDQPCRCRGAHDHGVGGNRGAVDDHAGAGKKRVQRQAEAPGRELQRVHEPRRERLGGRWALDDDCGPVGRVDDAVGEGAANIYANAKHQFPVSERWAPRSCEVACSLIVWSTPLPAASIDTPYTSRATCASIQPRSTSRRTRTGSRLRGSE